MEQVQYEQGIAELLLAEIPRDVTHAINEGLLAGARRAYAKTKDLNKGHRANGLGQERHFLMNEAFHTALTVHNASPTPIHGNDLIVGHQGEIMLGRVNVGPVWNNCRRSITRRRLCAYNEALGHWVEADLFSEPPPHTAIAAFFVAVFSKDQSELPTSIQISVPDADMSKWLFREDVEKFLRRYDDPPMTQEDLAQPRLKAALRKQNESEK
jgi:hypothetical protein